MGEGMGCEFLRVIVTGEGGVGIGVLGFGSGFAVGVIVVFGV
jgi:hypothetical protein